MDILLYLAIAIIIIYISGLVYALIPKEKVKIAAPNVDTDKRLFKDLNTIEEKVAEALRRLDWQINDDAEEYEAGNDLDGMWNYIFVLFFINICG